MDVLSEILRSMRLVSRVVSRARFTAPWAVHTSGAKGAIFHVVTQGECWLRDTPKGDRVRLGHGDLVLLSNGAAHTIGDRLDTHPVPISSLHVGPDARVDFGGPGAPTSILCGSFRLDHSAGAALLSALPPVVHVARGETRLVEWFDVTLDLVQRELDQGHAGTDALVGRILDVLFVQLLRTAAGSLPAERAGWLAAVQDENIGRALAAIHNEPGAKWTVDTLARRAGISRSVFFARFTSRVGESPAKYLARWRALAAADLLRESSLDLAALADKLGYGSEDAFGRAFKRHLAMTPREYRKALASGVDPSSLGTSAFRTTPLH